jgi:hypothetical protein
MTGHTNAVIVQFAVKFSAARGNLSGLEPGLAKSRRPIRNQRAVRGTCDGILWNSGAGCEKARNKIAIHAWCSCDYAGIAKPRKSVEIRRE